jgi:hypothetical protein
MTSSEPPCDHFPKTGNQPAGLDFGFAGTDAGALIRKDGLID